MHLTNISWVLLLQQAVVAAQLHPNQDQVILNHHDDADFVDSGYYYGINTFAHTRYVNCYSNAESKDNLYDIAIIGAPHDTVRRFCSMMYLYKAHMMGIPFRPRLADRVLGSAQTASEQEVSAKD
ncbi:hypothetical protein ACHAPJ_011414 [Fusarium lateritium]